MHSRETRVSFVPASTIPQPRQDARDPIATLLHDISLRLQDAVPHDTALLMAHDDRRRLLSVVARTPFGGSHIKTGDRFPVDGSAIDVLAGEVAMAVCLDTRVSDGTFERKLSKENVSAAVTALIETAEGSQYLLALGSCGTEACDVGRATQAVRQTRLCVSAATPTGREP
jgi:hypothetical protein